MSGHIVVAAVHHATCRRKSLNRFGFHPGWMVDSVARGPALAPNSTDRGRMVSFVGGPGRTRTCDQRIMSPRVNTYKTLIYGQISEGN